MEITTKQTNTRKWELKEILDKNLKLTLLLLDKHCAYATHLGIHGLDPVFLIDTIPNCLGWWLNNASWMTDSKVMVTLHSNLIIILHFQYYSNRNI